MKLSDRSVGEFMAEHVIEQPRVAGREQQAAQSDLPGRQAARPQGTPQPRADADGHPRLESRHSPSPAPGGHEPAAATRHRRLDPPPARVTPPNCVRCSSHSRREGSYRTVAAKPTHAGSRGSQDRRGRWASTSRCCPLTAIAADNGSGGVGTHLEQYAYLGLGDVVRRVRPQPGTELTYLRQGAEPLGDAGDPYAGLDRFGQVVDQRWIHSASGVAFDRFQYGHDRNGNPLFKDNLVSPAHGELYRDAAGGYDPLDRLVRFQRGTLNAARDGLAAAATRTQAWSLDPLGNWTSLTTDGQASSRTHNRQNQITNLGHSHDANGNLTAIDHGVGPDTLLSYDAWDRLVHYQTSSSQTGDDPRYAYDALHRRTHRRLTDTLQVSQPTDTTRYFYSTQWQVIFEQAEHSTSSPPIAEMANGGTGTGTGTGVDDPNASLPGTGGLPDPEESPQTIFVKNVTGRAAYVWSAVFVDAMVLRDRDVQGDGTYDERLYVQQDGNYNPASLSDNTGVVVERFGLDPYGVATFLDPNWSVDAGGSDYAWTHLHQGGRQDPLTGLVHFRFRDYRPTLGRWTQQDPAGYIDGPSRYQALRSNPTSYVDPLGLRASGLTQEQVAIPPHLAFKDDYSIGELLMGWRRHINLTRGGEWYDGKVGGASQWEMRARDLAGTTPLGRGGLIAIDFAAALLASSGDGVSLADASYAALGSVSQYADSRGGKGLKAATSNAGPIKRGPKPGLEGPHNQKIKEVADRLEAQKNTIIGGGKRPDLPETVVPTPGGTKTARRPDITYTDADGQMHAVNVGKTKADGTPVTREQDALNDLNGPGGLPTTFIPYDR